MHEFSDVHLEACVAVVVMSGELSVDVNIGLFVYAFEVQPTVEDRSLGGSELEVLAIPSDSCRIIAAFIAGGSLLVRFECDAPVVW